MRVHIEDVDVAKELHKSLEKFQLETNEAYSQFVRYHEETCNAITEIHNSISSDLQSSEHDLDQASKDVEEAQRSLSDCQKTESEETTVDEEGNETTITVPADCSFEESSMRQANAAYESARESYDKARKRYESSSAVYNKLNDVSYNVQCVQDSNGLISSSILISQERLKFAIDIFERALAVKFPNQSNFIENSKYIKSRVSNAFLNYTAKGSVAEDPIKDDFTITDEDSQNRSRVQVLSNFAKGLFFEKEFNSWCTANDILAQVRTEDTYINENYNPNDEFGEGEVIYTDQKNTIDFYFKDTCEIWEVKSGYESNEIKLSQMETYGQLLDLGYFYREKKDDPEKYEVKGVNYLFKTLDGLKNNVGNLRGTGISLWFINDDGNPELFKE